MSLVRLCREAELMLRLCPGRKNGKLEMHNVWRRQLPFLAVDTLTSFDISDISETELPVNSDISAENNVALRSSR